MEAMVVRGHRQITAEHPSHLLAAESKLREQRDGSVAHMRPFRIVSHLRRLLEEPLALAAGKGHEAELALVRLLLLRRRQLVLHGSKLALLRVPLGVAG